MKTDRFFPRFLLLVLFLGFGYTYQFTNPEFAFAQSSDSQTIPAVNLSDLEFEVSVNAIAVSPGDVLPFYLTITNTTDFPLAPFVLITTPSAYTTFSQAESSAGWLQSGTEFTPCIDGIRAGLNCSFVIDSLLASETVEIIFAVKIDLDLPLEGSTISLSANIYPIDQQPLSPNIATPVTGQDTPEADPTDLLDHALFLPFFN